MLAIFLCYILLAIREEIVMTKALLFAGDVSATFVSLDFFFKLF
jgi:hypothetical protein